MATRKLTKDMTISGRIRALRMALRKAKHPKVDQYDATYLHCVAEFRDTIDEAVEDLFEIDGPKKRKQKGR